METLNYRKRKRVRVAHSASVQFLRFLNVFYLIKSKPTSCIRINLIVNVRQVCLFGTSDNMSDS